MTSVLTKVPCSQRRPTQTAALHRFDGSRLGGRTWTKTRVRGQTKIETEVGSRADA